jgi:hypothetical protein
MTSEYDIPNILGQITELASNDRSKRLKATFRPCADLDISSAISCEIVVPDSYTSRGGIQIFGCSEADTDRLRVCGLGLGPEGDIRFPWMDGTTYPLAVWFYTVRQCLYKTGDEAKELLWATPIALRKDNPTPLMRDGCTRAAGLALRVGAGRNQGRRGYMEDVDFAHPNVKCGTRTIGLYGVLDGHGGADCAAFVSEELPSQMAACLRNKRGDATDGEMLYRAFLAVDK